MRAGGLVYFKNQRTFRLVNDSTMTPPWCIPVMAFGHLRSGLASVALQAAGEEGRWYFVALGRDHIPAPVGEKSDQPASTFSSRWAREDGLAAWGDDSFNVWPPMGEINAESFVVVYGFTPTAAKSMCNSFGAL